MLKVGLTGGIASGKSTVGAIFQSLGARVIQADQIAHDLMNPGQPVYDRVIERFGSQILNVDRTVNRARLAEIVFDTRHPRIQELNSIVHPAVVGRQDEWMDSVGKNDPDAIVVVEAALLLEAGAKPHFDRIVMVTCRLEQRIERWAKSRHLDEPTARKEVNRRMQAQWTDEEKITEADHVIDNSGSLSELEEKSRKVFAALAAGGQRC